MGMNSFAPFLKQCKSFIVRNVTPDREKTIKIFLNPINYGEERDLLKIRGVAEDDIRSSLLKGEIRHKFLAHDIELVYTDIDLLTWSECERAFLAYFGFTQANAIGTQIQCAQISDEALSCIDGYVQTGSGNSISYSWREKVSLIGLRNGINKTFFTPDKFINGPYFGNEFHISVEHNGKQLYENIDFSIGESGGAGTGYDIINIFSITPNAHSLLFANYAIKV